jgi:hypothetical protein
MAETKGTSYKHDVTLRLEKATDEILTALALQGEGLAKVNIRDNGQIDTGFMMNSVFTITPKGSNYGDAKAAAGRSYRSSKTGAAVDHSDDLAPEPRLPDPHSAAIAVGANYAVYQENQNSFLYRAVEQLRGQAGGVVEKVARDVK